MMHDHPHDHPCRRCMDAAAADIGRDNAGQLLALSAQRDQQGLAHAATLHQIITTTEESS